MRPIAKLSALAGETSGIAATEFALVLPLMLLFWLGMAQLMQLSMASAKTTLAAQSVADLVSRYTAQGYEGTGGFSDLEAAAATIIAPLANSTDNPSIAVVSATLGSSGTPTLSWSCTTGSNPPTSAQISTYLSTAPSLTTSNSSLTTMIMVTVVYQYSPTVTGGILGNQTFTATAFSTPRVVSSVPKPC